MLSILVETLIRFFTYSVSLAFSLCHIIPPFPPSSSFLHHPSLQSLSVLLLFALHDLPRNIEHVNSVCLKLGFGRRDQRCHNRITVPNHMGPPGTVRHPSLWCVCEEKVFLCAYAESSLSALFSSSRYVCTFLHILLLPPPKNNIVLFLFTYNICLGFFLYLSLLNPVFFIPKIHREPGCFLLSLFSAQTKPTVYPAACFPGELHRRWQQLLWAGWSSWVSPAMTLRFGWFLHSVHE